MSKLNIKKIAALGCAAAMMASLTACGEKTTWGAVIDGEKIPAGVFIYYLDMANYDAQMKYNDENPMEADNEGNILSRPPLYTCQIEGVPAKQWVYDDATKSMREYAAVEAKFNEYGLALSQEEKDSTKIYVDQMWDYAGDYYTALGISDSSYQSVFTNSRKRNMLFEKIYSEGGEKAVSDDEIKAYLTENYAMINYIDVELRDGEGNLLKSDGKEERMAMLNSYIERFNNGEDFDILNAEYVTYYENLKADAAQKAASLAALEAEGTNTLQVETSPAEAALAGDDDAITDDTENTAAETETAETEAPVTEAAETQAAETAETESAAASELDSIPDMDDIKSMGSVESNMTVIEKSDGNTPCKEVADRVFGGMENGALEIIESANGEHVYLVLRMDILEDPSYYDTAKSSILYEMKSDEFDSMVTAWVDAQSFTRNQDSYDRYDPEKLFAAN